MTRIIALTERIPIAPFTEHPADALASLIYSIQAMRQRHLSEAHRQPRQTKSAARNRAKRNGEKADIKKLAKLIEGMSPEQRTALLGGQS